MKTRLITFLLLGLSVSASAAEVYRWVDADGVVHFSDTLPDAMPGDVERLVVQDRNPPGYDPAEDPNNVMNQAQRSTARFAEVEKERADRAEKRQQEINIYLSEPNRQSPYLYGFRNPIFRPPLFPPQFPPQRPLPPSYRQQSNALGPGPGPRPTPAPSPRPISGPSPR